MGDVMHDYVNLGRCWPGTSNNYWNIDDLVRAYNWQDLVFTGGASSTIADRRDHG